MRIKELLKESPTVADVIRSAAQPTPKPGAELPGTKPTTTPTGTQPPGIASKIGQAAKSAVQGISNLNKDAEGNKINFASAVASKSLYDKDGAEKPSTQQQVDFTKIPPSQIQQHLRPGQQVDLGGLGKVKIGQVTPQGVEFDGTGTPIGAKFTVPFKSLG